jgi:hypothetical protein
MDSAFERFFEPKGSLFEIGKKTGYKYKEIKPRRASLPERSVEEVLNSLPTRRRSAEDVLQELNIRRRRSGPERFIDQYSKYYL